MSDLVLPPCPHANVERLAIRIDDWYANLDLRSDCLIHGSLQLRAFGGLMAGYLLLSRHEYMPDITFRQYKFLGCILRARAPFPISPRATVRRYVRERSASRNAPTTTGRLDARPENRAAVCRS